MCVTKVMGVGVPFKQAVNPEERVTHSLRNSAAAPHMAGEARPRGAWGGRGGRMSASASHSSMLIFLFLSPVS